IPRLPVLDRDSVANVQGLGSIPTVRLERRLGKIPNDVLTKLRVAPAFALDLEAPRRVFLALSLDSLKSGCAPSLAAGRTTNGERRRTTIALTRDFKETIRPRATRDSKFQG